MENKDIDKNEERITVTSGGAAASIIVAGIFLLGVVFIFSRVLFSSNSAKVPAGLDTATINTDIAEEPSYDESSSQAAPAVTSVSGDSDSSYNDSSEDESSQAEEEGIGVMYITEYAYLHTEPSNESENIICMSPGIEVTVLEYEDNGYVKITFMNVDGPMSGYIYKDYLSEVQTVIPSWQQ